MSEWVSGCVGVWVGGSVGGSVGGWVRDSHSQPQPPLLIGYTGEGDDSMQATRPPDKHVPCLD